MRIQRKRNDDEDAKARLLLFTQMLNVNTPIHLVYTVVNSESHWARSELRVVRGLFAACEKWEPVRCRVQEELYSYVTVVDTDDFAGLGTKVTLE